MEDLVPHLPRSKNLRYKLEVFDGAPDWKRLGDLRDPGMVIASADPLVRMAEHRVHVVGQHNPPSLGSPFQDGGIIRAG